MMRGAAALWMYVDSNEVFKPQIKSRLIVGLMLLLI